MRLLKTQTMVAAVLLLSGIAMAGHSGGNCCCPDCGHKVCVFEPEVKKEKKHCWEVECKDICIPKFKWPWECQCDPPSCGKVRTVKVLKKKEYECEKCGYKWSVQTVCDGSCDPCGPCGNGSVGGAPCVTNSIPLPTTAMKGPVTTGNETKANVHATLPTPPVAVAPVTVFEKGTVRTVGR